MPSKWGAKTLKGISIVEPGVAVLQLQPHPVWVLCLHRVTAANWKRKNNYCPKSDGGGAWDSGICETPLGQRASSGSQWVQWEFLYCHPVGTKWEPHAHTHTLTYSIFTSTLHYIYLLPISNFVFTEPRLSSGTRIRTKADRPVCTGTDNKQQ